MSTLNPSRSPPGLTSSVTNGTATITVTAPANFGFDWFDVTTTIVDLTNTKSEWVGQFNQPPNTTLYVFGRGTFDEEVPGGLHAHGNSFANGNTIIGVNVIGNGTINEFQTNSTGKLEFMRGVAATQTITDSGGGGDHGVVQIDSPLNYHAPTELGFGEIILEGLKATSYSLNNDLLSIFNGKTIVDTMNLAVQSVGGSSPVRFGVSQVGGSVVVHADGSSYHDGGRLLPMHG
jgi:hypothetical protein